MIPYSVKTAHEIAPGALPPFPAYEDEVFVKQPTFEDGLSESGVPMEISRALWETLQPLKGVDLNAAGGVRQTHGGKLYAVREMDHGLLSVDGLVEGLVSNEFEGRVAIRGVTAIQGDKRSAEYEFGRTKIGPRRLAMIAILGNTFTPDRSEEIAEVVTRKNLPVDSVRTGYSKHGHRTDWSSQNP